MKTTYRHLGAFSNLFTAAKRSRFLYPLASPGQRSQRLAREALAFAPGPEKPYDVKAEQHWVRDGIAGEEITWSVGYGPRTSAWLLRPAGRDGPLPGVVALHDHGAFKYYGKEKIADGPDKTTNTVLSFRKQAYGGRAFANALAREGFSVLVPDVFMWGSRRFPEETIPESDRQCGEALYRSLRLRRFDPVRSYNLKAIFHEHTIAKYCTLMGTTLAGVVAFEDRTAVNYLAGRKDVCNGRIGCVGLSGGGLRSALLQATSRRIQAAVVVGMMSTFEGLLDHNVVCHTWMLFPAAWASHGDWADLAACRAPSPLLVQYDLEDQLFTKDGMSAAHRRIAGHYRSAGKAYHYVGQFYRGPHKFNLKMQTAAFQWLAQQLG